MTARQRATAVGVFADAGAAERAVHELRRAGFADDEIGVAARDERPVDAGAEPGKTGRKTEEGTAAGAVTGGVLGGIAGAVVAGLIPGIGPVIAAGALAAVLGGAAAGVATGGIVGALIGMGIPETEARHYEREFQAGRTIVTVRSDGRYDEAVAILRRHGAHDAGAATDERAGIESDTQLPAPTEAETDTIELAEERLVAHTHPRELGTVYIRKQVEETPGRIEVDALHEEVEVEHVPVGEVVDERVPSWEEDGVLVVPVYEEQLVVVKRLVMREHLRIRRIPATETHLFEDTLRRDRVVIEDPDHTGRVRERYPTASEAAEPPAAMTDDASSQDDGATALD